MKKRNQSHWICLWWVVPLVLGACAPQPIMTSSETAQPTKPGDKPSAKVLQSQRQRDLQPQVSSADLTALAADNNAFALDVYQQLRSEDGNLFFSPYSLSAALAMTYAGARTETERQMAQAMHFGLPQAQLHPAFNALDLDLSSRSADEVAEDEPQPFQLNIANAIWGQEGHPFLPEFLDTLSLNYGAGLRLTDFVHELESSRLEINQWVEEQTQGRIKDLIPAGALLETTRLVLTNAIYFKADWRIPFAEGMTAEQPFNRLDGSSVAVEMMRQSEAQPFPYIAGEDYQAVELPYVGDEIAMLLLVPEQGAFESFENELDLEKLSTIIDPLEIRQVELGLPKFSFTQSFNAKSVLEELGMRDAFQPQIADFSGMDGERKLYIHNVFHKAFVAVDEQGTEAAAATAVIVGIESYMEPDVQLTIDRPFIFIIRDRTTGTILFAGRVLDPSASNQE